MQPPFQQKMPMPESVGPGEPMASPQMPQAKAQADRRATREVPREQLNAALQKGASAMHTALYKTKGIGKGVMQMINPQDKVGSTAKATTMFLSNLNKKARMPERIMIPMVALAADEIMQMAEASNRATYSEQEAKQVLLTSAEIVLNAYGVDPERAAELAQSTDQKTLREAEQAYKGALDG